MDKGKMDRDLADTSARKYACSNQKSGRKPKTKIASRKIQKEAIFLMDLAKRSKGSSKTKKLFSQFFHNFHIKMTHCFFIIQAVS